MNRHSLQLKNGKLLFAGQDWTPFLEKLPTPSYLYSEATIVHQAQSFIEQYKNCFKKQDPMVCYAMKANSNPSILDILKKQGLGVDIVSLGELKIAQKSNIPFEKMIFSGVGKTAYEIEMAILLSKGKLLALNVESLEELKEIALIAEKLSIQTRISVRLNPKVKTKTHRYISTGDLQHKFGIHFSEAVECLELIKKNHFLKLVGLSIHIGSQLTEMSSTGQAIQQLIKLWERAEVLGLNLEFLNVGGGLGIDYHPKDKPLSLPTYFRGIKSALGPRAKKFTNGECKLLFEPGRFLVARSGVLVTRVIRCKDSGRKHFVIVDGAMNDLIRPALYGAYHRILHFSPLASLKKGKKILADIVGPICESADFLAQKREMATPQPGDYIFILDAGAYGRSMGSQYNSRSSTFEWLLTRDRLLKKIEQV